MKLKQNVLVVFLGSRIVGVHCHFDPMVLLDAMQLVKDALEEAKLKVHLIVQPIAYLTPDSSKQGFIDQPEFPFGETFVRVIYFCTLTYI